MSKLEHHLLLLQRDYEDMLAAYALRHGDITVTSCAFVRPDWFINQDLSKFWEKCQNNGGDSHQAANDISLEFYLDLVGKTNEIPTGTPETVYAHHVQDVYYKRVVALPILQDMTKTVANNRGKFADVVALAQKIVETEPVTTKKGFTPDELHDRLIDTMVNAHSGMSGAVQTHITDIDYVLGALEAGAVYLLAADTSMGKTALALQIARNNAVVAKQNNSRPVVYFTIEMTADQVWTRIACSTAGVDYRKIISGQATPQEMTTVENVSKGLKHNYGDYIVIVDDVQDVHSMHAICADYKPGLVVVDHLDDVEWRDKQTREHVWRGRAITYLKMNVGKRFNCPVLILHQINRDIKNRQDKRPHLSDLRQDGTIEQKSDVVLFLYRDDYYSTAPVVANNVPAEVIFRKFRQGKRNVTVSLAYDLNDQWFNSAVTTVRNLNP